MTFKPGDEVVCVDDEFAEGKLAKGRHYTIEVIDNYFGDDTYYVRLDDPRTYSHSNNPVQWHTSRFRPVRKTSIDIFTSMLTPTPSKENVEA